MLYLESLVCPCCTVAVVQTLAQSGTDWMAPRFFLQLGKGALIASIDRSNVKISKHT